MTDDKEEWIPAGEAAARLATRFGGITRAQQAIATALHEGLLRARADTCAYTDDDGEFVQQEATANRPIEIERQIWRWSDNWAADVMRWDWDIDSFEVRGANAEQDRTFIGVTLLRREVDELDPHSAALCHLDERRETTGGEKRGPKANAEKWGAVIGAILDLERQNKLKVSDYPDVASLVRAVQSEIATDLWLDARTMQRVVGYVWREKLEEIRS